MQICGREFSLSEIAWLQQQIESRPGLNRAHLSRLFCEHINWRKADEGLKEMSCRVALLRLHRRGLIRLPAPQRRTGTSQAIRQTLKGEPRADIELAGPVELSIEPVSTRTSALWNELIDRYHYLGYRRMGGAQMRLLVRAEDRVVALLGFSAAAWRLAARDAFIGWSDAKRQANLHRIVDNSRFLILPWVHGHNLASRILALASRRLPGLWQQRYHYRPFLLETFVESRRFAGTCYRAANWICVGQSRGRGKWDRENACAQPIKSIFVYPLQRRYKELLCR